MIRLVRNRGSFAPGPGFERTFSRQALHLRVLRRVGLVGKIEERGGLGQAADEEAHPRVGVAPGALLLLEGRAGSVEGRGHDRVPDALARPLVAARRREVAPVEPAAARLDTRLVVPVHQLDAVAVGEAVERRVEVPALVELGLGGLVVDHHREAVLVGESEVEDAELDRDRRLLPVRREGERPLVRSGRLGRGPRRPRSRAPARGRGPPRAGSRRAPSARSRGRAARASSPVVSRGAAGLPGFQTQSAWLSVVTSM